MSEYQLATGVIHSYNFFVFVCLYLKKIPHQGDSLIPVTPCWEFVMNNQTLNYKRSMDGVNLLSHLVEL